MAKKIFIDANVILDLFEPGRAFHEVSVEVMRILSMDEETELFISSDMVSNIFYILQNHYKYGFEKTLITIENITRMMRIHSITHEHIERSIEICKKGEFKDFEDALQNVCALKEGCMLIITNNKKDFQNASMEVLSTPEFLRLTER